MKKYIFTTALATSLLITSCADNEVVDNVIPDSQKEMISFSLSDGASQTRAGFRGSSTFIAMRIQSDSKKSGETTKYTRTTATAAKDEMTGSNTYSTVSFTNDQKRYWDDAHGRYSKLSVYAIAIPNKSTDDDSNSLENKLKAVNESSTWGTNADNTIDWSVTTTAQTKDSGSENSQAVSRGTIDNEDLVYSNNIQSGGENGIYRWDYSTNPQGYPANNGKNDGHKDGQMLFYQSGMTDGNAATQEITEAPGHFDKGHLVFNHALTRLTINLKRGTGFGLGTDVFKFATGTNITLKEVPTKGKLVLATGTWSTDGLSDAKNDIKKMAELTANSGFDHTLVAQFIPGYTFNSTGDDASANVLQFTIDDNTYYITQSMVYTALKQNAPTNGLSADATSYTMEQGKNYELNITVNKTAIDEITATLIEWADVRADNIDATNSYITISTETMGTQSNACNHFDLYRLDAGHNNIYAKPEGSDAPKLTNWGGNYTVRATTLQETSTSSGVWRTEWFWESNKSFYHFRTVDKGIELLNTGTDDDDTFKVYSGPVEDKFSEDNISTVINDQKYNDYHWGAPMKSGADLTYNTTPNTESEKNEGYSQSLYCAIGSTKDQINIIEQHMMATVHFVIHTGTKANGTSTNAAVSLLGTDNKGTRVTLTNFAGDGTVKVGNGFITPSATMVSSDIPVPGASSISYSSSSPYELSSLETTSASFFKTASTETNAYSYRVVPQALYRGAESNIENETNLSNFIGLTIVTPDDNQYYVIKKLYGVNGTVKQSGSKKEHGVTSGSAPITRWYPGYDYTYHIYLNKTGIEAITCTVVDWVKVEGNIGDVNLES